MKKRILVAEDHPVTRSGIVQLLKQEPDLRVCGEVDNRGDTILAVDRDPPPDLVFLDLMLGHADGLETIKQLRAIRPGILILVVSAQEEWLHAERVLRAGASGYIMKTEPNAELLAAVRAVLRGEIYLSARMRVLLTDRGLISHPCLAMLVPQADPPLSDREFHVYRLIGIGLSTKQIATELHLGGKTIETYKEHLKIKLRLANAEELKREAKAWVVKTR